jgi:hypothetical protein
MRIVMLTTSLFVFRNDLLFLRDCAVHGTENRRPISWPLMVEQKPWSRCRPQQWPFVPVIFINVLYATKKQLKVLFVTTEQLIVLFATSKVLSATSKDIKGSICNSKTAILLLPAWSRIERQMTVAGHCGICARAFVGKQKVQPFFSPLYSQSSHGMDKNSLSNISGLVQLLLFGKQVVWMESYRPIMYDTDIGDAFEMHGPTLASPHIQLRCRSHYRFCRSHATTFVWMNHLLESRVS